MRSSSQSGNRGGVLVPLLVTIVVGGSLWFFRKVGLFDHIGRVPTGLLVGADAFVVGLAWFRGLRGR
jgi:hypothetical protein